MPRRAALGALAAGEGATAVMALVLLVTTLFGRTAPVVVRLGLARNRWARPTGVFSRWSPEPISSDQE
ncbi:hypothetical protein ACWIGH_30465, partial [Streptomyces albidoflavus]